MATTKELLPDRTKKSKPKPTEQESPTSVRGLPVGQCVSISPLLRADEVLAAKVAKASRDETVLNFRKKVQQFPFDETERVRIHYWAEKIVYCWDAEVMSIGPDNQHVQVALRGEGVTAQRRNAIRINVSMPFSFTIVEAQEAGLAGQKVFNGNTQDISVNGLKFETGLPLQVGDNLEMSFQLRRAKPTPAFGWVVRVTPSKHGEAIKSIAVKFLQMDEEDQMLLLRALAECSAGTRSA